MEAITDKLNAPLLGDVIREAEKTGNEGIVMLAKVMVNAAKEAGFTDATPMRQVISFLGSKEYEACAKVQ